ncbi:MAG: hypothetical protein HGB30_09615 [Holophagaceae bacterium]|nr:hypothetical protein [Holophagaceae bacterium]
MPPLDAFLTTLGPLTWDDLVAGYDFGLLTSLEIQSQAVGEGLAAQRLRALEGSALLTFEAHLWAACAEAQGVTPRPGSLRWAQAQDRWREALLLQALATDCTRAQLAQAVERLYEQVGCPEDMLAMLQPAQVWSGTPATVDPKAVKAFLDRAQSQRSRHL